MDNKKPQSIKKVKSPQDKLHCEICDCQYSRANKSQHCKTKKHIKAKDFNDSLLRFAKSHLIHAPVPYK